MKTPEQIASEAIKGNLHLTRPYIHQNVMRLIECAIEDDRAQREEAAGNESSSIYWAAADADEAPPVYGAGSTAAIIDNKEGGVIAYCHEDTAPRIVRALRGADA